MLNYFLLLQKLKIPIDKKSCKSDIRRIIGTHEQKMDDFLVKSQKAILIFLTFQWIEAVAVT